MAVLLFGIKCKHFVIGIGISNVYKCVGRKLVFEKINYIPH